MSIFYIIAGIVLIIMRIGDVPAAFAQIFAGAFSFKSVGGGLFGYTIMMAMRQGFARGVFSNEAGLGSAPIAHAASSTEEPCEQAIWGVFEVFIDTIVICTITSFAIIMSGVLNVEGGLDALRSKGAAAAAAFNSILPGTLGGKIIELSLLFFALSTILSWAYYGENCWGYLTNNNKAVPAVQGHLFAGLHCWRCRLRHPDVGHRGYPERPDGDSQPDCPAAALRRGGESYQRLFFRPYAEEVSGVTRHAHRRGD